MDDNTSNDGLSKYLDDANLDSLGADENAEMSTEQPAEDSTNDDSDNNDSSLADQLANFETQDESTGDLISMINELGIVRNGLPVEFDNVDTVKELISKGNDYTQKTKELAKQREEQEATFKEREQEIQTKLQEVEQYKESVNERLIENHVMEMVLNEIKTNDPDVFNEIASLYQRTHGLLNAQQNNPVFKQFENKISQLENSLKQTGEQQHNQQLDNTLEQWNSGLSEVQNSYGKKLRSLGVKPNWSKVKETWQNDSSNSMSVEAALLATHGAEIQKALEAQSKLAKTKAQSQTRQGPQNNINQNQDTQRTPIPENGNSYMKHLEKIAEKYA